MGWKARRLWVTNILIALLLVGLPSIVRAAAPTDRAEDELVRSGIEARRRQDDAGARELFVRAYALHHSPRAAAQIGLAEIALGRWVDAEDHIEEALAATNEPWIRKNRKILEDALARVRQEVGLLEVLGTPDGADIVIGGEVRGILPLKEPIHVRAGDVRFDLRATGFETESRTVHAPAGVLTRETVELSGTPRSAASHEVATLHLVQARPLNLTVSGARRADSPGHLAKVAAILVSSVGVVALGGGLAFGLKARSLGRSSSSNSTFDPSADAAGHRDETLEWIGLGVGGALLIGGVATYLIGSNGASSESQTAASFIPVARGGIACWGGVL